MPNQYGEITANDWNQLTGVFSNVAQMQRAKREDERKQTLFDQGQEEREAQIMARQEVLNAYKKAGVVDDNGNITDQGYQMLVNPQSVNKTVAIDSLKSKGKHAFSYLKAQTEFTGELLQNATNMNNLHMLAFKKADETYANIIMPSLKAAEISANRGDRKLAAQNIANAITGANHRIRARAVGDKIETWQVVNGERQAPQTLNIEDAFALAKEYTRENYVPQAAAEIVAGYQQNQNPKTFELVSPDGKKQLRAVQIFKPDSTVDYIFFNKDGGVAKDAPDDLEQAYKSGWTQITAEGQKASLEAQKTREEIRHKRAQTEKVIKETGEVGKEKTGKTPKDTTDEDRQKFGEKRMKYVDEAMATFDETNMEATPEERKKAEKDAEARFNTEVMGWTPVGRNKKTGEIMYQTPEGELVNSYGRPMKPKGKSPKLAASHKPYNPDMKKGKGITGTW